MVRKCPHCGLINPADSVRCDCGFDFGTGAMKKSYLQSHREEKAQAEFDNLAAKHGSAEEAWKAIGRRNMLQGAAWCVFALIFTAVTYAIAVSQAEHTGQGTYFIAIGSIIMGVLQLAKGVRQYRGGR